MPMRSLITTVCCFLLAVLAGCFPCGVGDAEKAVVDQKFVGTWWHAGDKQDQLWFVHQQDPRTYLVQAYSFYRAEGQSPKLSDSPTTARAWLTEINGATFISLEMIRPQKLIEPKAPQQVNRFVVARLAMEGKQLSARAISHEFVQDKPIATPAEFEKVIRQHFDDPELYVNAGPFTKIEAGEMDSIRDLLDLIK